MNELIETTALHFSRTLRGAGPETAAASYEAKARLHEHLAIQGDADQRAGARACRVGSRPRLAIARRRASQRKSMVARARSGRSNDLHRKRLRRRVGVVQMARR